MKKGLCIGLACMVMISMGCMKKEEAIGLAVVKLRPTLGHVTRGIVTFEEEAAGVISKGNADGAAPPGEGPEMPPLLLVGGGAGPRAHLVLGDALLAHGRRAPGHGRRADRVLLFR